MLELDDVRGNADPAEIGKFHQLAHEFWDPRGSFRPLHLLNPARCGYVASRSPLAGAALLDVGCGGGLLAEAMAARGARVTGIDLAPAMIEVARLHALEGSLDIDYRLQSAEALAAEAKAPEQGFEVITCMEMLEHVPDPAALIGTLARLLRPGGQLFVSTLNRNLRSFLMAVVGAEYVLRLLPRGTHEYGKFLRPAELAAAARRAGLGLRDVSGLHFNPLNESCTLDGDPGVNYLAHFQLEPRH
ncbi:MAG TPA: bifunctional 2-polyprenyl-6-hydroxyphenol methylase/3-demethylubiquinol 3-O-methyltransferase UbiG [Steroidobacteraceae bacterium]|nr:bifunctional 2-polyprenyl-6-hydroxyphenol methylase/3-demethylubiquinol 3-O-methyltransferase UbiG [Steroidobacteraceae bacterium]